MPFKIPTEQASYRWHTNSDGLPVAKVITLGKGRWIACCPCCGCIHDLMAHTSDVYTPNCILKVTHPAAYKAWVELYPDAPQHKAVRLVTPEEWQKTVPALAVVPTAKATKPKKSTRRKAA